MYKVSEFVIGNSDFSLSEHLMPAECGYVTSNHWIFNYDGIECSSIFVFVAVINANTFCRCNLIYKRVWLPWLFSIIFFAFATDTEQNTIYTVMSFINPFSHVKKIIVYLVSIDLIFIFFPTLLFLTVAIFLWCQMKWVEWFSFTGKLSAEIAKRNDFLRLKWKGKKMAIKRYSLIES